MERSGNKYRENYANLKRSKKILTPGKQKGQIDRANRSAVNI